MIGEEIVDIYLNKYLFDDRLLINNSKININKDKDYRLYLIAIVKLNIYYWLLLIEEFIYYGNLNIIPQLIYY